MNLALILLANNLSAKESPTTIVFEKSISGKSLFMFSAIPVLGFLVLSVSSIPLL